MTTDRLYYTDSYLTTFEATVVDRADDGRRLYLDRTAFYPTSGGQPHDTGRIGGVRVTDVVDEGDRIAHLLETPIPPGPVRGTIDWPRRFDHMQQHTGQHLLSAVLADRFGYQTISVHFGAEAATLDLDTGSLSPAEVRLAETEANAIVTENRPVDAGFEESATATGLRKPPDRGGTIRVVTIRDLDRSACGGTHVRATGEVGPILIRRPERVKQHVRLEFLCGRRAVTRARDDFDLLAGMATTASAAVSDLPALFEKQRADLGAAEAARRELVDALARHQADELYRGATPDAAGLRRIVHHMDTGRLGELRGLAQSLSTRPRVVMILAVGEPPALMVAASADSGVDAGALLKPLLEGFGGRGGGSARLAQGTLPDRAALEQAVRRLVGG